MAGEFWLNDPVVEPVAGSAAAPPSQGPQPIFTVPNPRRDAADVRDANDDERADADQARKDAANAWAVLAPAQVAELGLPPGAYQQNGLGQVKKIGGASARPAADPDRIPQVQTALDNIRRIREMANETLSVGKLSGRVGDIPLVGAFLGQNRADIEGALNMVEGDLIQQQIAKLNEINGGNGVASLANSETEARRMASAIANLSPDQSREEFLLGLQRAEDYYTRQLQRIAPDEGSVREVETAGGLPVGTEIEFGMGAQDEQFDRGAYLQQTYGVTPNQESLITAFWNQNSGNKSLTVPAAMEWYQKNGLPAPDPDMVAGAVASALNGEQFGGFDTSDAEAAYQRRIEGIAGQRGEIGATALAGQGLMAGLGDEAAGIGGAIAAGLRGDNMIEAYGLENDVRDYQLEQARQQGGWGGTAAEVIGNAASLGAGAVAKLPGTMRQAVGEAAGAGAVAGYGYGEGAGGSLAGAALGAGAGAVVGRALGPRGPARPPSGGSRVVQAADALNQRTGSKIVPLPADVGGATTRRFTGGIAQSNFGAAPIINAAKRVNEESGNALQSIAREVGTPQEIEIAGQTALAGAQQWMKTSRAKVNSLYARARQMSEGVAVPLTNARQTLDKHIAELQATPGGSKALADLAALRDELGQDYTIDAIKGMRTTLRDRFMGDGLRKTDVERRVGQVIDAAEQDAVDGLVAAGRPEAAQAWKKAAAEARTRLQTIDTVMAPIIGKRTDAHKSGEQIMQALGGMSRSNNARLAQFINALPADEAGTVRATVISRLGTKNAGGGDFTLGQFLGQWEKMTPGAKRTLFGGELTEAMEKLAIVAGGAKEAAKFANFSNTGSTTWTAANMGGAVAGILPGVLMVAAQYGLGRLLASPAFTRWLARMPAQPAAASRHIEGLSRIAAAETGIATQALGLQRALSETFSGGSARASVQQLPLAAEPTQPEDTTRP